MSVVKNKRNKSSIEFESLYFKLADNIDNLVEHKFYANKELIERNDIFLDIRCKSLEDLTDKLLFYIKIANSIYPTCVTEYEERRTNIGKAIGTCYAILTHLHRIMMRIKVNDNKYVEYIETIAKMINSLKAWRKSGNKFKTALENK